MEYSFELKVVGSAEDSSEGATICKAATEESGEHLFTFIAPEMDAVRFLACPDGTGWFVLQDVCEVLEVDSDEVKASDELLFGVHKCIHTVKTPAGRKRWTLLSEQGVELLVDKYSKHGPQTVSWKLLSEQGVELLVDKCSKHDSLTVIGKWVLYEMLPAARTLLHRAEKETPEQMEPEVELGTADTTVHSCRGLGAVRVHTDALGEPWFVARDVCRCLGHGDVDSIVHKIDVMNKASVMLSPATGCTPEEHTIISPAGLYQLVSEARDPEAKSFYNWIMNLCRKEDK